MRKNTKKTGRGGGRAITAPRPRYHPIWFKTSTLKDNCLFKLLTLWGKNNNFFSQFPAKRTYIKPFPQHHFF